MSRMDQRLVAHPINHSPYNRLEYVRIDGNGVPLYQVKGCDKREAGAPEALARAFQRYGGKCFYCGDSFGPQSLTPKTAHRDHVVPTSLGGSDLLHNLVIACVRCGTEKANLPLQDFKPKAAKNYFAALEKHIANSIRGLTG